MRTLHRTIIVALTAALGAQFAGCKATYTVDILNSTTKSISVRVMQDRVAQDPVVLASDVVPPGETITIGPLKATLTDDVTMHAGQPTELGFPDNHVRLYPGQSSYELVNTERAWSGVEIIKRMD